MNQRFKYYRLMALALLIVSSPAVSATAISVAIVPIKDNLSDDESESLTHPFNKALSLEGLNVVSQEKVEAVLNYHKRDPENDKVREAEISIAKARQSYYDFEYERANEQIKKAVELLESEPQLISDGGRVLRDAYITGGVIMAAEKDAGALAEDYFAKALRIDPQYELSRKTFSPSVLNVFNAAKNKILNHPLGSVEISSDPKVAKVFVNGIQKGVTPATMPDLPEGIYNVSVRANNYKSVEKEIIIRGHETSKLNFKLQWAYSQAKEAAALSDDAYTQTVEGVRAADLLKVDKVVLIDADEKKNGSGVITVRMVDREFRASHHPVIVNHSADEKAYVNNLAETAAIIAKQAGINILDNAEKHLDAKGTGDPIILGKRSAGFSKKPFLLMAASGVLAATIGALASAGSGGAENNSSTGSVHVQFK
ncbi:MAG: PEGA domain-containing protein [Deltaproteobacteria bacterium]|nr:PEGA domain-containing protein [Deltaproteobacteria bacterium]MBI2341670.1 PEGA domain-containing protein [Deltaproteobacteria bacterium]MBI2974306.1 PEGA domain-containing protein [Deltaproteobacteria bacterium]